MLSWIFSRLIGRLLRSGASRRHLGRPDSRKRSRTDHFSPCEPDPIPPIRIHHCNPFQPFVSDPIFTWPYSTYGNCNSRFFPCLSLSGCADICMARKDFVIVDQLSELLRARIQPMRCQDSDRSQFLELRGEGRPHYHGVNSSQLGVQENPRAREAELARNVSTKKTIWLQLLTGCSGRSGRLGFVSFSSV